MKATIKHSHKLLIISLFTLLLSIQYNSTSHLESLYTVSCAKSINDSCFYQRFDEQGNFFVGFTMKGKKDLSKAENKFEILVATLGN